MKRRVLFLLGTACLALAARADDGARPGAETALPAAPASVAVPAPVADGEPLVLRIGVNDIYCRKTACDCIGEIANRSYDTLLEKLKTKHHITLEFTYFLEVWDLEKAIQADRFDGVLCKPWTALQFAGRTEAKLKRVADLMDPDNKPLMTGVFLTTAASPIRNLADLQGKRIALGKPDAYEKHQAPLAMLAAAGVKPADQVFYSSCGENLNALMDGKVDVAVVSSYALTASCAVDFAKPEDFKTIAETEKMPLTSLLLDLNKVPEADARRVQAALLDLSGDKVPEDLTGLGFVGPVSWKPLPPPPKP